MMNNLRKFGRAQSRPEKGFALFATMMLLIALMVVSMTFLRTSSLSEKMVGNDLDRARAYQVAEATMRDAQRDILAKTSTGLDCTPASGCRPTTAFPDRDSGLTDFPQGCSNGVCYFDAAVAAAATFQGPWIQGAAGNLNFSNYGQFTGADWTQLSGQLGTGVQLSQRPRYWIEPYRAAGSTGEYYFRITVQAWGVNPNSVVTLQEIYFPGI